MTDVYQMGIQDGHQYAERAHVDDPESFDSYAYGAAKDAWAGEVPSGSRDWYEAGYNRFSAEDWSEWDRGFRDGVDGYEAGLHGTGMGDLGAQCTQTDRIELCLVESPACWDNPINGSSEVAAAARAFMICDHPQESTWVFCINPRGYIMGWAEVSKGSVDEASVTPGDVLRIVLASGTRNFIFLHNHPSGDPQPSQQDRLLTMRIAEAARICGFKMLDHVIVASGEGHYSFRDEGQM